MKPRKCSFLNCSHSWLSAQTLHKAAENMSKLIICLLCNEFSGTIYQCSGCSILTLTKDGLISGKRQMTMTKWQLARHWKGASLEDTLVCNNDPPTPEWLMREDTRDISASKKQFWCYKWDCDCDWDWVLLVASKCRAPYGANNSWKQENVTCVTDISNIRKTWQGVGWGELLGLHTKDGGGTWWVDGVFGGPGPGGYLARGR